MLSVTPQEDETTCSAGAAFELSVGGLEEAGTFAGTLDTNGTAEGGEAEVTLNVRKGFLLFLLLILVGVLLATLLALLTGPTRQRHQLDMFRRLARKEVGAAQQEAVSTLQEVFTDHPEPWKVVSDTEPKTAVLMFDKQLARLRPPRGLLFAGIPSDILPGGKIYEEVNTDAQTLITLSTRVKYLMTLYKEIEEAAPENTPDSPSLRHVRRQFVVGPPALKTEELSSRITKVTTILDDFDRLRSELNDLANDTVGLSKAFEDLYKVDLTDEGAVKAMDQEIANLRKAPRRKRRGFVGDEAEKAVGTTLEVTNASQTGWQGLKSRLSLWLERAKRMLLLELTALVLSLVIACAAAWATLYTTDPSWGSTADVAAALTWAFGVGSVVQVARYVTFGTKTQ
jgi:hypothetical protein